ncbi:hypothetical protein Bca52824_023822 [Brassica carinata]|uniref:Gnk2-homologous domain-containing protein n=1 Tax=Brassica carinata TaxID=52824 RepID=A0A8X8ATM5_BRACI|nr:hypothetical protein Bca52824_023822 [Brassica carinata]
MGISFWLKQESNSFYIPLKNASNQSSLIGLLASPRERKCCLCADLLGPGGTFDRNRHLILTSLASEVTANDGFFNASTGTDPDQVYAMRMCIPGAKQELCSGCIKAASDQPSFRQLNTDPPSIGYNTGDLRKNLTAFDRSRNKYQVFTLETADDITTAGYLQFDVKEIEAATNPTKKGQLDWITPGILYIHQD